mmetsp:Transcript_34287/g.87877  ORF Transcript_34287/g.87877 Transcript_34287/m.87877 type:complete len:243 (-) Transcript_34287:10-738(-)
MSVPRSGYPLGCSAEAAQAHEVVALVGALVGRAQLRGTRALLLEAASLPAGSRQTAQLTVLHHRLADPVDARVITDGLVERVHHHHLVPLVHGVLSHPVGVQHAQAAALAANALLGNVAQVAHGLPLLHALVARLAVDDALGHALLAVTALHADAVDQEALLGLVANLARLVRARGPRAAVDGRELAELPVADARNEAEHVRLLLAPHLLEVLVCAHGCPFSMRLRGVPQPTLPQPWSSLGT